MASSFHSLRPLWGTALALSLALTPALAYAGEPSAADKETARALMAEGRQKRDANDLKGALKSFRGADALMHVPTTAFEVAKTEALAGELVEARDHALTIARSQAKPGEPAPFAEARTAADALAAELEGRIPSLKIHVVGAKEDDVEVRLDDSPIPSAALGLPRKLNPGAHVIVAKNGADVRKIPVEVKEREAREATIDFSAAAAPPPPGDPDPPDAPLPPEQPSPPGNPVRTGLVLGGFGVAVVGTVIGSITGGMSLSKTSTLKEQCPNDVCPAALEGELGTANTLATVSTISFVFAGAGLVTGIVALVALKSTTAPATASRPHVTPWIGLGSAGLSGTF